MPTRSSQASAKPVSAKNAASNRSSTIGISITDERGQNYRYRAHAVSLHIKRGVVQIAERKHGCFVWFKQSKLEVRSGRRSILFRLLAGSASSEGSDLTIIAELAHRPRIAATHA